MRSTKEAVSIELAATEKQGTATTKLNTMVANLRPGGIAELMMVISTLERCPS
jgi:hypothetical protein